MHMHAYAHAYACEYVNVHVHVHVHMHACTQHVDVDVHGHALKVLGGLSEHLLTWPDANPDNDNSSLGAELARLLVGETELKSPLMMRDHKPARELIHEG